MHHDAELFPLLPYVVFVVLFLDVSIGSMEFIACCH